MKSQIITSVALDSFTERELEQIRKAGAALDVGDSGLVVLPGRPEFYKLTRRKDGIGLDVATDEEVGRLLAGGGR